MTTLLGIVLLIYGTGLTCAVWGHGVFGWTDRWPYCLLASPVAAALVWCWRRRRLAFPLVFLPLADAYAVALQWVWDLWRLPDSYYSHGPLLPLVAAFVVWRWRPRWHAVPAGFDARGWWLLAPGLLAHAVGVALTIDSLSAATLVLTVPGAVWLAVGAARARVLWPVLGLVAFAVPLPLFASGRLAFELKEVAVSLGLGLANLVGLAGTRAGAALFVPGQSEPLVVEDPCGGLRSLLALTTLGYCFAFLLTGARARRRVWLLVLSVPLALGLNVLRIAFLCFAAKWWGPLAASTTVHDAANAGVWVLALVSLVALDRRIDGGTAPDGSASGRST